MAIPYGDPRMMRDQQMQQQDLLRKRQMNVAPMNFNPDAGGVNGFAPSMPQEMPMSPMGAYDTNEAGMSNQMADMQQAPMAPPPQYMQAMKQRLMQNKMRQAQMGQPNAMGQAMGNAPAMDPYRGMQEANREQMIMNRNQMMGERPAQALPSRPAMLPGAVGSSISSMRRAPLAAAPNKVGALAGAAKTGLGAIKSLKSKPKAPVKKKASIVKNKPGAMMQEPPTF